MNIKFYAIVQFLLICNMSAAQVAKSGGSQAPNRRNPLSLTGSTGTKPQKSNSIDEKDSKQDGGTKNDIENNKDLKSSNKKTENQKASIETSSIKGDNNSKTENGNGVGNKQQQQQKQNNTNGQKSGGGEVKPNQIINKLEQHKMKDVVVCVNNIQKKPNSLQNQEQEKSSQENNKKNNEKEDLKTKSDNKKEDLNTKSDNKNKKENSSSKDISKETTTASKDVSTAKDEAVKKNSKEVSNGKDESSKKNIKEASTAKDESSKKNIKEVSNGKDESVKKVSNGKEIITKDKLVEQENGKNEKSEKLEKPSEPTPAKEGSKTETSLKNKDENSAKKISTDIILLDEEDEMEALVVDPDIPHRKILKMKETPPPAIASPVVHKKIIPEKKFNDNERSEAGRKFNRSNITEMDSAPPSCTSSPITNDRPYVSSLRSISGRRSLRPVREYSFQNTSSYRENYRRITTEFDNTTTSSLNVTIGSEIPNESTFSFFTRGKKREYTTLQPQISSQYVQQNDDIETSPKSPKRARLDFSGIFGFVSSPVSMLRARLSRAKIQSSTPNSKDQKQTNFEEQIEEDCVENVSVFETEDVVDNNEEILDNDVDVDIKSSENIVEDDENLLKKQKRLDGGDLSVKSIEDGIDVAKQQEEQDILMTSSNPVVNRRRMCNVM